VKADDLLVRPGQAAELDKRDPRASAPFEKKSEACQLLTEDLERLAALQDVFYAAHTHALLIVLQGMDSSGKDGAVKHVMSGVNPAGVDVYSSKQPTQEELAHDFLWRHARVLPARGRIGIFNRSHYEEVVVVRVHEDLLAHEGVTPSKDLWAERFEDINAFERHLDRNGTVILKFFLHLSKGEQRERLLKRLDDPRKYWKFSEDDAHERLYWNRYHAAYESALTETSTEHAPWYVIPADRKWFARTAIANIIVAKLDSLGLTYPRPSHDFAASVERFRQQLASE
jgi:PPK2 family polyphosphate:nucleotide phosphotransferase